MSRIESVGVYQVDVSRLQENTSLGAVPPMREVGADTAPFAAEWLQRLQDMSEPSRYAQLAQPRWTDPSAPPTKSEMQQALMTAFRKAESTDSTLAKVIERYLRLNLEMAHRST